MQQTRLEFLFHQHFKKLASGEEEEEFHLLVEQHSHHEQIQELMERTWGSFTPGDAPFSEADGTRIFKHIIGAKAELSEDRKISHRRNYLGTGSWAAVAAALLLVIGAGLVLYELYYAGGVHDTKMIPLGRHAATLTLANGKIISLSDTKNGVVIASSGFKYNDGSAVAGTSFTAAEKEKGGNGVSKVDDEQHLIASTPTGGTYQIVLQDGTHVWLNAESKLEFPASFAGLKQRVVRLTGEAYFEVAKRDRVSSGKAKGLKIPFIVTTAEQSVEVLGTHFNIFAYADEHSTRTTLMEGAVKVAALGSLASSLLKPNQQAILTRSDQIYVKEVDAQTVIDWKNDEFVFHQESLESIMRKVCRWYGVTVTFTNAHICQQPFSGSVSRFGDISQLISVLESTKLIKFKVEGKQITISPL